jgi:hypothetical protein
MSARNDRPPINRDDAVGQLTTGEPLADAENPTRSRHARPQDLLLGRWRVMDSPFDRRPVLSRELTTRHGGVNRAAS